MFTVRVTESTGKKSTSILMTSDMCPKDASQQVVTVIGTALLSAHKRADATRHQVQLSLPVLVKHGILSAAAFEQGSDMPGLVVALSEAADLDRGEWVVFYKKAPAPRQTAVTAKKPPTLSNDVRPLVKDSIHTFMARHLEPPYRIILQHLSGYRPGVAYGIVGYAIILARLQFFKDAVAARAALALFSKAVAHYAGNHNADLKAGKTAALLVAKTAYEATVASAAAAAANGELPPDLAMNDEGIAAGDKFVRSIPAVASRPSCATERHRRPVITSAPFDEDEEPRPSTSKPASHKRGRGAALDSEDELAEESTGEGSGADEAPASALVRAGGKRITVVPARLLEFVRGHNPYINGAAAEAAAAKALKAPAAAPKAAAAPKEPAAPPKAVAAPKAMAGRATPKPPAAAEGSA